MKRGGVREGLVNHKSCVLCVRGKCHFFKDEADACFGPGGCVGGQNKEEGRQKENHVVCGCASQVEKRLRCFEHSRYVLKVVVSNFKWYVISRAEIPECSRVVHSPQRQLAVTVFAKEANHGMGEKVRQWFCTK